MYKLISFIGVVVLILGTFSSSCKKGEDIGLPVVSILSPANNAEVIAGNIIDIKISAVDSNGEIQSIKLFIDDKERAESGTSPFTFSWNTKIEKTGNHNITVICKDNDENSSSASIEINIVKGI